MTEQIELTEEDFTFVQKDETIYDAKLNTKPIGYLKDAWLRFKKNKASVVAAIIIMIIVAFGLFYPLTTSKKLSDVDTEYSFMRPKNSVLSKIGICDGLYKKKGTVSSYAQSYGIGVGYLYREDNVDRVFKFEDLDDNLQFASVKKINKVYQADGLEYLDFTVDNIQIRAMNIRRLQKRNIRRCCDTSSKQGIKYYFP